MLTYRQVTQMIFFILLNMLIASCSGATTEKQSKEEKGFITKLKNDVNLPPDQWVDLEKKLRNMKDNASTQDLEVLIYMVEASIDPSKRAEEPNPTVLAKEYIKPFLLNFDALGTSIRDAKQIKRILTDLLEILKNFKQQAQLKSKK